MDNELKTLMLNLYAMRDKLWNPETSTKEIDKYSLEYAKYFKLLLDRLAKKYPELKEDEIEYILFNQSLK